MEQGDGNQPQSYIGIIITPHTALRRVSPSIPKRKRNVLRIKDIWIP